MFKWSYLLGFISTGYDYTFDNLIILTLIGLAVVSVGMAKLWDAINRLADYVAEGWTK